MARLQVAEVKEVTAAPRPLSCPGEEPTSSHHSRLSHPASTRWCSGALSYKNNLSWADGGGGGWGAQSPGEQGRGQRRGRR